MLPSHHSARHSTPVHAHGCEPARRRLRPRHTSRSSLRTRVDGSAHLPATASCAAAEQEARVRHCLSASGSIVRQVRCGCLPHVQVPLLRRWCRRPADPAHAPARASETLSSARPRNSAASSTCCMHDVNDPGRCKAGGSVHVGLDPRAYAHFRPHRVATASPCIRSIQEVLTRHGASEFALVLPRRRDLATDVCRYLLCIESCTGARRRPSHRTCATSVAPGELGEGRVATSGCPRAAELRTLAAARFRPVGELGHDMAYVRTANGPTAGTPQRGRAALATELQDAGAVGEGRAQLHETRCAGRTLR